MTVVSDTSPLNYLVLTDAIHILPALFGHITVPQAVLRELAAEGAPARVRKWTSTLPVWVDIQVAPLPILELDLDLGETEAIALALACHADLLLLDDRKAVEIARERGLAVVGTLGLWRAGQRKAL